MPVSCALSINPHAAGSPSESDMDSSQFPHEQCYTRVNSLTNDAIQYGTHGTHSASQFHERYNAVRMIRTEQDPHERRGTHLASFITYGRMLWDKTTGWNSLHCLCQLTAYQELVQHFSPSSPALWLCFEYSYC